MDVYDVGPLPVREPPGAGEAFTVHLDGVPPSKTYGRSMRNAQSSQRPMFLALRRAAITAMAGRKWYEGPVGLHLIYRDLDPPGVMRNLYLDGIMDTLGASQGPTFVYLPIVYIDDCQVAEARVQAQQGHSTNYSLTVTFLEP